MQDTFYTSVLTYGDHLLYNGYKNGERVSKKIPFSPFLFVPSQDNNTEWSSIEGVKLAGMQFDTIKEMREFINNYQDVDNFNLYGIKQPEYQFINKKFNEEMTVNYSLWRIFNYDIEVKSDDGFPDPKQAVKTITSITLRDSYENKTYRVWGLGEYKVHRDDITIIYKRFDNEVDMLSDFLNYWVMNYPDGVTGWYTSSFDNVYVYNRLKKLFGDKVAKTLSPWNIVKEEENFDKKTGQKVDTINIYGIADLDYMVLFKKFVPTKQESYKLDYIGFTVTGKGKISYEGTLYDLYIQDHQKFIEYNIRDVETVQDIDNVKKFIELLLEIMYEGKVARPRDALGTVKFWEVLIYNYLINHKVVPSLKTGGVEKGEKYEGAYVKEPVPDRYHWVSSFDLTSLYPSIIRQVNIGPETHVSVDQLPEEVLVNILSESTPESLLEKKIDTSLLKKYDLSLSANSQFYRRDKKSFLSELMGIYFNKRKTYKKSSQNSASLVKRIEDEMKSRGLAIE